MPGNPNSALSGRDNGAVPGVAAVFVSGATSGTSGAHPAGTLRPRRAAGNSSYGPPTSSLEPRLAVSQEKQSDVPRGQVIHRLRASGVLQNGAVVDAGADFVGADGLQQPVRLMGQSEVGAGGVDHRGLPEFVNTDLPFDGPHELGKIHFEYFPELKVTARLVSTPC